MSDYVFNVASVAPPFSSADEARAHLATLLRGIAAFEAEESALPTLRLDSNPWVLTIAKEQNKREYSMGEIASQMYGTLDHDVATFFEALATAIPSDSGIDEALVDPILRIVPERAADGVEAAYSGTIASGIHGILCAMTGYILTSIPSDEMWNFDRMGFQVSRVNHYFDHLANPTHAIAVRLRRRAALRDQLAIGNFWNLRQLAFPHLRFGIDTEDHVRHFSAKLFPLALKRLAELDERARQWKTSGVKDFPEGVTAITPETKQTMDNYGNARRFRGHDGVTRTFEDHMWIDKGHRIHLIRHASEKVVEIGYIGKHLPTMKYST